MKQKFYTLTLALTIGLPAFAAPGGLFVEPMLTYEQGEADVDLPSPFGSSESDVNGFGMGARLGVHVLETVFVGMDGRYSHPTYENDDTNIHADAVSYNYGPVVGAQIPLALGIRAWAGYILGGVMDVDKDQGVDLKFKDANGYRLGGGVKIAMLSLNLEYQQISYEETELQDAGLFSGSTGSVDQVNRSYILSVSFPLSL